MHRQRIGPRRCAGAGVVEKTSDPAGGEVLIAVAAGLPDLGRAEMAAIGIGVADVLDDPELPVLKKVVQPRAGGMEPQQAVEPQDIALGHAERRAQAIIGGILKGHHGIQSVVTPGELHEDKNRPVLFGGRGGGEGGLDEKRGRELAEGEQADPAPGPLQELAPRGGQEVGGVVHGGRPSKVGTRGTAAGRRERRGPAPSRRSGPRMRQSRGSRRHKPG